MPTGKHGKLLIIVGAGASAEVGLPVSKELKRSIAQLLAFSRNPSASPQTGDEVILEALRNIAPASSEQASYRERAIWISEAMPQALSIDNFIDAHKGDAAIVRCGKLAIARAILAAERVSSVYVDATRLKSSVAFGSIEDSWFNKFFQLLVENCQKDRLEQKMRSIAFINFNYDRCVEHFLFHALQNYYRINHQEAAKLVNVIQSYHPYGTVGCLPWQHGFLPKAEFGAEPGPEQLINLSEGLRTFAEGTNEESSEIGVIRDLVGHAKGILFLGFAFHRLNMQLLASTVPRDGYHQPVYGTALGISNSDIEVIKKDIAALSPTKKKATVMDLTCSDLLSHFWRTISSLLR